MTKQALKIALAALGNSWTEPGTLQYEIEQEAITAITEAIAELESQEPVAHVYLFDHNGKPRVAWDNAKNIKIGDKLYIHLPQRTWVGLTADEIWDEWLEQSKPERNTHNFVVAFTRAIEAKLKDKNCAG